MDQQKYLAKFDEALQYTVNHIAEEVIKESMKEYEEKLRKAIGQVAIKISEYYNIQRVGGDLIITVKWEQPDANNNPGRT